MRKVFAEKLGRTRKNRKFKSEFITFYYFLFLLLRVQTKLQSARSLRYLCLHTLPSETQSLQKNSIIAGRIIYKSGRMTRVLE